MRIVYLLESAAELWGGVKAVLEDANDLTAKGHTVTVLAKSSAPSWMPVRAPFQQVPDFGPQHIPPADVVVGTFWTTVAAALQCGRGAAVHYCQGYEGDSVENQSVRERIEAVYRLPTAKVTIAPHLRELLQRRFPGSVHEVVYAIDHDCFRPGAPRGLGKGALRVGLVGPWQIAWKDLRTGYEACALARRAGLDFELVRISNTGIDPEERTFGLTMEAHERVPPARMGDLYRSLDVMLCTSSGPEEGFFLPAVEAMACGVPCVMTDVPCFRGYSERQHALFVPAKDPAAMAEALVLAATHPSVGQWLRAEGIAAAARFTRARHLEALEVAFGEIAAEHRKRSPHPTPLGAKPLDKEALLRRTTEMATALRAAADAWSEGGDQARALAHLEAAASIHPEAAELLEQLGAARFRAGDASGASAALERALACGASGPGFWNDLGVARHATGDTFGARTCFTKALILEPANADANANLLAIGKA